MSRQSPALTRMTSSLNISPSFPAVFIRTLSAHKWCTRVLISTVLGLISLNVSLRFIVLGIPRCPEVISLFCGFAPLIMLLFLLIIGTLLYSLLICSVGQIFADDDTPVPKPSRKVKLHFSNHPFSKIEHSLSLKEHSPPILLAPCH